MEWPWSQFAKINRSYFYQRNLTEIRNYFTTLIWTFQSYSYIEVQCSRQWCLGLGEIKKLQILVKIMGRGFWWSDPFDNWYWYGNENHHVLIHMLRMLYSDFSSDHYLLDIVAAFRSHVAIQTCHVWCIAQVWQSMTPNDFSAAWQPRHSNHVRL